MKKMLKLVPHIYQLHEKIGKNKNDEKNNNTTHTTTSNADD